MTVCVVFLSGTCSVNLFLSLGETNMDRFLSPFSKAVIKRVEAQEVALATHSFHSKKGFLKLFFRPSFQCRKDSICVSLSCSQHSSYQIKNVPSLLRSLERLWVASNSLLSQRDGVVGR